MRNSVNMAAKGSLEMQPGQLFKLELMPVTEDDANEFHAHPLPASTIVDADWVSGLYFEAGLVGVLHGNMKLADCDSPATLLVLCFTFTKSNANRNSCFKKAKITLRFAAKQNKPANTLSTDNLKVFNVSPRGVFAVDPVRWQSQEKWNRGADGGFDLFGAKLGMNGYLESSRDVTVVDKATVTGEAVVLPEDIDVGRLVRRAAQFTMEENPTTKGGIPSRLQVAVLVRRNPGDDGLVMSPEIDLWTGTWQHTKRKIRRFLGFLPDSEATIIDATNASNISVKGLSAESIDEFDLDDLSDVVSVTQVCGIRSSGVAPTP